MSNDKLATSLAWVLVALPSTAELVPNLSISPEVHFVLLVLALIGGAILKQGNPMGGGRGSLTAEERREIAAEQERIRMGLARREMERKAAGRNG